MRIDLRRKKPVIANKMGGFSGSAIFPVAVRMVYQVYDAGASHQVTTHGDKFSMKDIRYSGKLEFIIDNIGFVKVMHLALSLTETILGSIS